MEKVMVFDTRQKSQNISSDYFLQTFKQTKWSIHLCIGNSNSRQHVWGTGV